MVSGVEDVIPQGLKPPFSPWLERPEAEASGYLEAKADSFEADVTELGFEVSLRVQPRAVRYCWMRSGVRAEFVGVSSRVVPR
jgi:hypothetical protein